MKQYDAKFKEEAVKLSEDIGLAPAANQLGIPYQTLSEWRKKRTREGTRNQSKKEREPLTREEELEKENAELRRANQILQDALCFFVERRKK